MPKSLNELRPLYVVGIGWHRYQNPSETPYKALGFTAIREALRDTHIEWPAIESGFFGTAQLDMTPGRPLLRHLGAAGAPVVNLAGSATPLLSRAISRFRLRAWHVFAVWVAFGVRRCGRRSRSLQRRTKSISKSDTFGPSAPN
jgi:hypothetical protein